MAFRSLVTVASLLSALCAMQIHAVEVVLFGPEVFTRTPGVPNTFTATFPGVVGVAEITVFNGDDAGSHRVSSAVVMINDQVIFGQSSFNQQVGELTAQVDLEEQNELLVYLMGNPGGYLTIEIVQNVEADAAAVIGPDGGSIAVDVPGSPIDGAALEFPPGAVTSAAVVSIREYDPSRLPVFPDFLVPVGTGVDLESTITEFAAPVRIVVPYPDFDSDGLVDGTEFHESHLSLYRSNSDFTEFELRGSSTDQELNLVVAESYHFTSFIPFVFRWRPSSTITYSIDNFPSSTTDPDVLIAWAVHESFLEWWIELRAVGISFVEVEPSQDPDIRVLWTPRDLKAIGLTTGYLSLSSGEFQYKIELSDDLDTCCDGGRWSGTIEEQPPAWRTWYVKEVLMHELGHAIGLDHVDLPYGHPLADKTVMVDGGGYLNLQRLGQLDIAQVRSEYGIVGPTARWDFETDPGFTSSQPADVYWDSENGWYVATVRDVSTGVGHYYGLSPSFPVVSDESFVLEFDFNVALQNWGSYPAVYLVDGSIPDPVAPNTLRFSFAWTDATYKVFELRDHLEHVYLSGVPAQNTWYHVWIDYNSDSSNVNLRVTNRSTGALFWELIDEPLDVGLFDTIALGQRTVPPRYGTLSTAYYDNIVISRP